MKKREALWFYAFISPWLIGALIFTFGPMLYSFYLSFTDWDLFSAPNFIAFKNFVRLFTRDRIFGKALFNTFYFAFLSVPINMILSLAMAYLLNRKMRGMRVFRTIYYIPSVVPVVALSLLFMWVFAPDTGLLNRGLAIFGIDGPAWLLDPSWVKPALIVMGLWGVGGSMILLLAGMQGIPEELYEAAEIDGAGETRLFFNITLPMLTPVIFFNLVMGIIGSLQTFSQVYILTAGGPNNASTMMVPFLFDHAFQYYRMGYASSIAWVLFAIIMFFTMLVIRSSSIWVFYESEVKGS